MFLILGGRVRVWIKATDIIGNTKTDSTLVRVDSTPPIISKKDAVGHRFQSNVENGKFNYTSRYVYSFRLGPLVICTCICDALFIFPSQKF